MMLKLQSHFRFDFVAKPIEEIITENREKVPPASTEISGDILINEDWFHSKV